MKSKLFFTLLALSTTAQAFKLEAMQEQGVAWWTGNMEIVAGQDFRPAFHCEFRVHETGKMVWGTFSWRCPSKVVVNEEGNMANHPNRSGGPASNPKSAEIRKTRLQAGLSQHDAAKLIHCNVRTWQQWESDPSDEKNHRRMHPAFWELFKLKAASLTRDISTTEET